MSINLTHEYPIDVPVVKSRKAKAQEVQELALDILSSNDNAVVIGDKLGELRSPRVRTFQGMKGYNGWSANDVFIVLTFLAPEVYARLNTLGVWLGLEDSLAKFYAAQLSQAVGRNTGFRAVEGTKCVVVSSGDLLRLIQPQLAKYAPRVRLNPTPQSFWTEASESNDIEK